MNSSPPRKPPDLLAGSRSSSTGDVTIRSANHEDLPAIMGIYNWAVNQTFATIDSEPLSREEAESWWEAHVRRNPLVVAEENGEVVGWARLLPWNKRGFDLVEDLVYVDPVHHGRGIGRQLLAELIERARDLGYHSIVASVAADNKSGLELHQKLGFELVGTLADATYKFDRWMDIALVQKKLVESNKV
jgi:phosphinothricin acetyltransferase